MVIAEFSRRNAAPFLRPKSAALKSAITVQETKKNNCLPFLIHVVNKDPYFGVLIERKAKCAGYLLCKS